MTPAVSPRALRRTTALVFTLLGASACFLFNRGNKPQSPSASLDPSFGEIALNIANHNYLDIVVYVLHDGQKTRIGTATGSASTLFYLPAHLLGQGREIQLLGDPIGSTDYALTPTLIVQSGQYIEWTLETDLRRSSVGVF